MTARISTIHCVLAVALLCVAVACAEAPRRPPAAARPSGQRPSRGAPHTKPSAATAGSACADGVAAYLRHAVTGRSVLLGAVADARAELNNVRGMVAEEKDGQGKKGNVSQAHVKAAMSAFESASEKLRVFDEQTLLQYGNIPTLCIDEVEALRVAKNPQTTTEYLFYYAENVFRHFQLFGKTAKGLVNFAIAEYAPMVEEFKAFTENFRRQSVEVLESQKGLFANAEFVEKMKIAMKCVEAATLASVPYTLFFAVVLITLLFAPFIAAAVIVPHLLWRVWTELFILHHIFGLSVNGFLAAVRRCVDLAGAQNWGVLKEELYNTFLLLTGTRKSFYSGLIAGAVVFLVACVLFSCMIFWIRVQLRLIRGGKSNKGSASGKNKSKAERRAQKDNNKNQKTNSGADSAAANKKKKA